MNRFLIYTIFIFAIILFIFTVVVLQPVELLSEYDPDARVEDDEISNMILIGFENKESIEQIYKGQITLNRAWLGFKLIFIAWNQEIVDNFDNLEIYYNENKQLIKERFGIDNLEDFKLIANCFNDNQGEVTNGSILNESIKETDEGISFKVKIVNINNNELIYDCIIYNIEKEKDVIIKILPENGGVQ